MKIGRTDPCHCGSGKRYKNCCRDKDEAAAAAAAPAPAVAPAAAEPEASTSAPKAGTNAGKRNVQQQTHARPKGPPPPRPNVVRKHAV
jgi:hypothetical protein